VDRATSDRGRGSGAWRRVRPPRIGVRLAASVLIGVGIVLLWALLAKVNDPTVLPGPGPVWSRFILSLQDGSFLPAAGTTAEEAVIGWLIAAVVALPLGYVIGRSRFLEEALAPYLAASLAMPIVAISPLLLIWLGPGLAPKVWISALIAFFPMLATTASGVRGVPRDLSDAGQVFGATGWMLARVIYLPLAARAIFSGMKVAAALTITGAVVGEFIASDQGLGYLVNLSRQNFDPPLTYVAVIALVLMGALAYSIVSLVERLVLRWDE
jgi:NitT/TauT family transport system permease protein